MKVMGHLRGWLSGCVYGAERLVVQWPAEVGGQLEQSCLPTAFSLRRKCPSPSPSALLEEEGRPRVNTGRGAGGAQVPAYCDCHPSPNPHHPPAAGAGP